MMRLGPLPLGLLVARILVFPVLAESRTLTLTTQLRNYDGDVAYLAVYLADADGCARETVRSPSKAGRWNCFISLPSRTSTGRTGAAVRDRAGAW